MVSGLAESSRQRSSRRLSAGAEYRRALRKVLGGSSRMRTSAPASGPARAARSWTWPGGPALACLRQLPSKALSAPSSPRRLKSRTGGPGFGRLPPDGPCGGLAEAKTTQRCPRPSLRSVRSVPLCPRSERGTFSGSRSSTVSARRRSFSVESPRKRAGGKFPSIWHQAEAL